MEEVVRMDEQAGPARPSDAATERLRKELQQEVGSYADAIDRDLLAIDELGADEDPLEAVLVLHAHIERLEALHARVRLAVAGAVAEREAESVIDEALGTVPPPPPAPVPAPAPEPVRGPGRAAAAREVIVREAADGPLVETASAEPRHPQRRVRLQRMAALLTAVVGLAVGSLGLPTGEVDPLLTAVSTASEQASQAAAAVGVGDVDALAELESGSEALEAAIGDLPPEALGQPEVRDQVVDALTGHRDRLVALLAVAPDAARLIREVERLAADLGLALPPSPVPVLPGPPAVDADVVPVPAPEPDREPIAPSGGDAPAPDGQGEPGQPAQPAQPAEPDDQGVPADDRPAPSPPSEQPPSPEPTEDDPFDLDLQPDGDFELDEDGAFG